MWGCATFRYGTVEGEEGEVAGDWKVVGEGETEAEGEGEVEMKVEGGLEAEAEGEVEAEQKGCRRVEGRDR
jgi:hypothetical protein